MRAMGIDYGEKRIGLAISDPTGRLASPLTTLVYRKGKRPPLGEIERIAREREVEALVVGLPLDLSGSETDWTAAVRKAGDAVAARLAVPVAYVDERMTSVRAERLVRTSGLRRSEREKKERVDAGGISRVDGSSKMLRQAILSQSPKQLSMDDSPESLNTALLFESFDFEEIHKS